MKSLSVVNPFWHAGCKAFPKRLALGLSVGLMLLILANCSQPISNGVPSSGATPGILMRYTTSQPEMRATMPSPTRTPISASPVASFTEPVVLISPATQPPTVLPPTPWPVVDRLCSPLEFVDLKNLPRVISDGYNPPPKGSDARHQGIDLVYYHWQGQGPIDGTLVKSVLPGVAAVAQKNSYPLGNVAIIETPRERLPEALRQEFEIDEGFSLYVLYAHMKEESPFVALGQPVAACQSIGQVGKTGNTDAPHLHFETRVGPSGLRLDGFSLYVNWATQPERQNYRLWSVSGQYLTFDPLRLLLFSFSKTQ